MMGTPARRINNEEESMIGVSDESRHKVLRWLERCKHQLAAYIPDEDKAELAALIAELENAEPVCALTKAEALLVVDEIIPAAIDDEFQYSGDSSEAEALYAPLRGKLIDFLSAGKHACTPVYPCPKCGKDHAIALPIPFSWGCDCGCKFGVDYGISKTGRRCWVHTGVLDLRAEATT